MARRARDFKAEYQRRIAEGRGRGHHPAEFTAKLKSPRTASVVPDVQRDAQGHITKVTLIVTDVNGKQTRFNPPVRTDDELKALGADLTDADVPYLPGYAGTAPFTHAARSQTIITPGGPRSLGAA